MGNMYFPESSNIHVSDPHDLSLLGDVVLISKLKSARRNVETHELKEIIYRAGHYVDPLVNMRVDKEGYLGKPLKQKELKEIRAKMQPRECSHEYSFEHSSANSLLKPYRPWKKEDIEKLTAKLFFLTILHINVIFTHYCFK